MIGECSERCVRVCGGFWCDKMTGDSQTCVDDCGCWWSQCVDDVSSRLVKNPLGKCVAVDHASAQF